MGECRSTWLGWRKTERGLGEGAHATARWREPKVRCWRWGAADVVVGCDEPPPIHPAAARQAAAAQEK